MTVVMEQRIKKCVCEVVMDPPYQVLVSLTLQISFFSLVCNDSNHFSSVSASLCLALMNNIM